MQELAETIQQLRQAQITLTAKNERLREGQAGVQALVFGKGIPRIGKSSWIPKVWVDLKCLTTKKKASEGGFGRSTIWLQGCLAQTATRFWKVVCLDSEDPIDLQDLADNQHPYVDGTRKGWRTTVSGVVPSMYWGK